MTYAERLGATHIVDVATLTGAVVARARPPGHRRVRDAAGRGTTTSWPPPTGPASATGRSRSSTTTCPEMESWYGDLQNSGSAEGSLDQERPVPARVPDRAVGPPRHRRDGLLPQDDAVRAARARPASPTRRSSSSRWPGAAAPADGDRAASRTAATAGSIGRRAARRRPRRRRRRVSGVVADRLAARWPEHDEEHPAGRAIDWRTAAVGRDRGARVRAARRSVRGDAAPLARSCSGRGS